MEEQDIGTSVEIAEELVGLKRNDYALISPIDHGHPNWLAEDDVFLLERWPPDIPMDILGKLKG